MSVAEPPALAFDDVSVVRGGRLIWSEGTFDVPSGGITAVIGSNGSGKTTFLNILSGLDTASEGSISLPREARLGVLRQDRFLSDEEIILDVAMARFAHEQALRTALADKDFRHALSVTVLFVLAVVLLEFLVGFAVVMVLAGIRMLRGSGGTGTACTVGDSGINWRRCASRSIPAGFLVGLLTGLFGVGGGFLIIPALVLMLGVEMPVAIGTSLLIIVANSLAGLLSHLSGTSIDWTIAAAFVGTAIVGSLIAGHLGTRLDTRRLQRWFAYLVFAVAAYVLVDTIVASW